MDENLIPQWQFGGLQQTNLKLTSAFERASAIRGATPPSRPIAMLLPKSRLTTSPCAQKSTQKESNNQKVRVEIIIWQLVVAYFIIHTIEYIVH